MFSYFAYGLRIQSDLAIPEFPETDFGCDREVAITLRNEYALTDYLPEQVIEKFGYLKLTRKDALFYIKQAGIFLVTAGAEVTVIPAPGVTESLLRFYLVGTVMGILLYQRGLLVLHASAVDINGEAVAFLGESGEGKSSAAGAFQAANYGVMTDDVAPIILDQTSPILIPGFPQIKLSREIAIALDHDFESLAPLHSTSEKRGYRLNSRFVQRPLTVRHIYVLATDSDFRIERLAHQDAVVELSRHSRPSTLFHKPDSQHFLQCVSLARECPVYRLSRPRDLALLPELVHQVTSHLSLVSLIGS